MATEVETSHLQITDANGDPVSGALVYIYDVGTTTLKNVYSDTGLSAAADNPIACDSSGRHAIRYIAAGSYKYHVKTSAGVSIYDPRDNVDGRVPVGSGALAIANGGTGATTASAALTALGGVDSATVADLAADVAALAGAAASTEKTHLATGTTAQRPASPAHGDIRRNTTTSRIEHYNGSGWENVFTDTEIASAGDATTGTDNTKVMTAARVKSSIDTFAGWTFISAQDASTSATIDFTGLGSTYEAYEIRFSNVKPATDDVQLWVRIGTGAGPTYQSGASDYAYQFEYVNTGSAAAVGSNSAAQILLNTSGAGSGVGNASGEHISGFLQFDDPENATDFQTFQHQARYLNTSTALTAVVGGAGKYNSATAVTAVRFLFSSGNITSGRFALYGLRRA